MVVRPATAYDIRNAKRGPVQIPEGVRFTLTTQRLIETVEEARDWPQPIQDQLIPVLMVNGFKTLAEQEAMRKRALLRAAALDPLKSGRQRAEYAREFGRPNAIRLIWWLRRMFGHDEWDG